MLRNATHQVGDICGSVKHIKHTTRKEGSEETTKKVTLFFSDVFIFQRTLYIDFVKHDMRFLSPPIFIFLPRSGDCVNSRFLFLFPLFLEWVPNWEKL